MRAAAELGVVEKATSTVQNNGGTEVIEKERNVLIREESFYD